MKIQSEESDRLNAGHFKALSAADILASDEVFGAHHVTLRLGEARAVTFIGIAGNLRPLPPDEPVELVLVLLATVRAGHLVRAGLRALLEKIAFFHDSASRALTAATNRDNNNEYCILEGLDRRARAMAKKAKKRVFSVVKAVKENARARVGTPPPEKVLPDPKAKEERKPKYRETLSELIAKNSDEH